ncbi:unnamed protein product [Ectocarpus sp. CCAP 1310/34]|nr:unnamed protein product [Ectocarpus sp. CCAP 1310/34]
MASRWRFQARPKGGDLGAVEAVASSTSVACRGQEGNMDLFRRLMDAGADGEAGWRGCDGRTLLGAAACGNNIDKVVRALLTAGAKSIVNVRFGSTPESALHVAAARGAEDLC